METALTIVICLLAAAFVVFVLYFASVRRRYVNYCHDMRLAGLEFGSFEQFLDLESRYGKYVRLGAQK